MYLRIMMVLFWLIEMNHEKKKKKEMNHDLLRENVM